MSLVRQEFPDPFFQETTRTSNKVEYTSNPNGKYRLFDILAFAGAGKYQVSYQLNEHDEVYKVFLNRRIIFKDRKDEGLINSEMVYDPNKPVKGKACSGLRYTEMEKDSLFG